MPRHFHNQDGPDVVLLPKERAKVEFSRNLYEKMSGKGWTQSDLAREASKFMPAGEVVGRDSISIYMRAKALPRGAVLKALADALRVETTDLLPPQAAPSTSSMLAPPLDVQDAGNNEAWLRVNQRVPWEVAIAVMTILKGAKNVPTAEPGADSQTG